MSERKRRKRLAYVLAAECGVDWRTAMRWILGETISQATNIALTHVAETNGWMTEVERHRAAAAAA